MQISFTTEDVVPKCDNPFLSSLLESFDLRTNLHAHNSLLCHLQAIYFYKVERLFENILRITY